METNELKFLLKLLGCLNYRSSLSSSSFKSLKDKGKICRDLAERGLLDFDREIATINILPAGSALLKMEKEQLPLTANELKILENLDKTSGKTTPSKITVKSIKSAERDTILQSFQKRGLIEIETQIKKQKAEVWLTQRGIEYLRDDYIPKKGNNPVISLELLNNYLHFLRKSLPGQTKIVSAQQQVSSVNAPTSQPSDEEILQIIKDLDRELGTENYLPIFHLREKLQLALSREQLDQALYRIQRNDKIELSSLQEAIAYTPEQIDCGIPQDVGGPLFFIAVN